MYLLFLKETTQKFLFLFVVANICQIQMISTLVNIKDHIKYLVKGNKE